MVLRKNGKDQMDNHEDEIFRKLFRNNTGVLTKDELTLF